jgi:hypothetical protein
VASESIPFDLDLADRGIAPIACAGRRSSPPWCSCPATIVAARTPSTDYSRRHRAIANQSEQMNSIEPQDHVGVFRFESRWLDRARHHRTPLASPTPRRVECNGTRPKTSTERESKLALHGSACWFASISEWSRKVHLAITRRAVTDAIPATGLERSVQALDSIPASARIHLGMLIAHSPRPLSGES